jgi:hypothetical protein
MAVYMATLANGGTVDAASAQGGRRWQRMEAGAGAAAAIAGKFDHDKPQAIRDGL